MLKHRFFPLCTVSILLIFGVAYLLRIYKNTKNISLEYFDYSSLGKEYNPLKNILMKASWVEFEGAEKSRMFKTDLWFSKFKVKAPIEIQTGFDEQNPEFKVVTGTFIVRVAPDPTDKARQELLREINSYLKNPHGEFSAGYFDNSVFGANKFLWSRAGRYVLYSSKNMAPPYLYASGKIIYITCDQIPGYEGGREWEFIERDLIFKFPNTRILYNSEYYGTSVSQFLKQYKNGYYKTVPK